MNEQAILQSEKSLIDYTFREFGINAWVSNVYVVRFSHICFEIAKGPGQRIEKVVNLHSELTNAVANYRNSATHLLVRKEPRICIEIPYPYRTDLQWSDALVEQLPPHTMLIGKSFSIIEQVRTETIAFDDDSPHYLVVGTTGAGKSVLMQQMIASMCYNTPPDELRLVIVDPKLRDLARPFRHLPHVAYVATSESEVVRAVQMVYDEKERRRTSFSDHFPHRLILVIDEIIQLASLTKVIKQIDSIASIGRGIEIHCLVGTQHPTREGGVGGLFKSLFPVRLVGKVAPGSSHAATNMKQMFADRLPGRGSFLKIGGADIFRFQSFNLEKDYLPVYVDKIRVRWHGQDGDRIAQDTGRMTQDLLRTGQDVTQDDADPAQILPQTPNFAPSEAGQDDVRAFPLHKFDELSEAEKQIAVQMSNDPAYWHRGNLSMQALADAVFGSSDMKRKNYLRQVLNEVRL